MARVARACFERYQHARVDFVSELAEMAGRPELVDVLVEEGALGLLRPLLADAAASVQQTAALALGRLANHSTELAEQLVAADILPQLVASLGSDNKHLKKTTAFVLRCVAKHTPQLAQCVVDAGALPGLTRCLEDFDAGVKEAGAWALGNIASHDADLAGAVVSTGCLPLLVLCIQEPEVALKRVCASTLSDIANHTVELARLVCAAGAVQQLARLVNAEDGKLKRHVCAALSNIAKHTTELAEMVVEAEVFPRLLACLKDADVYVCKNAAVCVRDVCKHSAELASLINTAGGPGALVEYLESSRGNARLAGITALGFIAGFSETLALAVIKAGAVPILKTVLLEEPEDYIKAAAAWALGQIGRHSPDTAKPVAESDALRHLLAAMVAPESSEDLQTKAKRALKGTIAQCTYVTALQPLVPLAPPNILTCLFEQFAKILPTDAGIRRTVVQSGGLKTILSVNLAEDATLTEYLQQIVSNYPAEVVAYCSPQFADTLAQRAAEATIRR